ncbi:hypothetical protein HS088_TW22G00930 [Tripterygium wilfordii]|uniref:RING-type domain-containing protein n=1 Tax=Tripterygium wilfordii TaxID=458696 RepID=A0A7J7BZE1_TRIWF|nr:E3 ubiquitin-protein ligase RNF170-like [Tripterygium wilfordii]KAF5727241.1 hypothetical protein HS088_TW22G00930 [Tripterygium wilfordii]
MEALASLRTSVREGNHKKCTTARRRVNDVVFDGETEEKEIPDGLGNPEDVVVMDGEGEKEAKTEDLAGEGETETEYSREVGPPLDDCCPICFSSFTVPCRSNCNHWFCGSCILQFWNYSAISKPCRCPMCSSNIIKLTPEASLFNEQELEVSEVIDRVQRYNSLFVGGVRGAFRKVLEFPLFFRRTLREITDPDRPHYHLNEVRIFAMVLGAFYAATPFEFIPTGRLGIVRLFDYVAIMLVFVLRLVGIYRRRRLAQNVRQLAAAQPLGD